VAITNQPTNLFEGSERVHLVQLSLPELAERPELVFADGAALEGFARLGIIWRISGARAAQITD